MALNGYNPNASLLPPGGGSIQGMSGGAYSNMLKGGNSDYVPGSEEVKKAQARVAANTDVSQKEAAQKIRERYGDAEEVSSDTATVAPGPKGPAKNIIMFGESIALDDPSVLSDEASMTDAQRKVIKLLNLERGNFDDNKAILVSIYKAGCNTNSAIAAEGECSPMRSLIASLALRLLDAMTEVSGQVGLNAKKDMITISIQIPVQKLDVSLAAGDCKEDLKNTGSSNENGGNVMQNMGKIVAGIEQLPTLTTEQKAEVKRVIEANAAAAAMPVTDATAAPAKNANASASASASANATANLNTLGEPTPEELGEALGAPAKSANANASTNATANLNTLGEPTPEELGEALGAPATQNTYETLPGVNKTKPKAEEQWAAKNKNSNILGRIEKTEPLLPESEKAAATNTGNNEFATQRGTYTPPSVLGGDAVAARRRTMRRLRFSDTVQVKQL